jgi:ABC-type uncharacterized transport system auxiliary subunit
MRRRMGIGTGLALPLGGRLALALRMALVLSLTVALPGIFAGCGGKVPATRYYTLEYDVDPPADPQVTADGIVLGIEPFSTQPIYRDRRMACRVSGHEVVYYPYRYWAALPGELVASQLAEHIRKSNAVADVEFAPYGRPPDWILSGHVAEFEQVKSKGPGVVRLALSVRVEIVGSGEILRQDEFAEERPVEAETAEAVAAAMSLAMRNAGERVIAMLREEAATRQATP